MRKPQHYRRTFIREWRLKRGLSLRQLASRLEHEPGGKTLSHASIGRIENRQQAYTQPIIEAVAVALGCEVADLLYVHPDKAGDVIDLTARLKALPADKRSQALDYLRFLTTH